MSITKLKQRWQRLASETKKVAEPKKKAETKPTKKPEGDTVAKAPTEEEAAKKRATESVSPPSKVPPEATIDPERKRKIDEHRDMEVWPAEMKRRVPDLDTNRVVDTLKGKSPLGELSDAEKQYYLDGAIDTMTDLGDRDRRATNYTAIRKLREAAEKDPSIAGAVSEAYARRAVRMQRGFDNGKPAYPDERALAATFGTEAVLAAGNTANRARLIERLGPEDTQRLGRTLDRKPTEPTDGGDMMLGGSSNYAEIDVAETRLLAAQAAKLAVDPARLDEEGARFDRVLATSQGQDLFRHDFSAEQKYVHAGLVLSRSDWDADLFTKTESAFDNPDVARALAAPQMKAYVTQRGDRPQPLAGDNLENTVGFAFGMKPKGGEGTNFYTDATSAKIIAPVAEQIRAVGGDRPEVTVLPVQLTSKDTGAVQLKLFRVQDAKTGADRFVDNLGRKYDSFADWKANNKLPPGTMTFPPNGHLTPDAKTEVAATPAVVDTPGEHVTRALDWAALVGGTVAGGAVIVGSGGTMAPIVMAGAAAWGAYRNIDTLADRSRHGQSIDPLASPQARAEWLGLTANVLGFASIPMIGAASRFARLAPTVSRMNTAANVADAATAIDTATQLVDNWDELSADERAMAALSIGYWGANAMGRTRLVERTDDLYSVNSLKKGLETARYELGAPLASRTMKWADMTPAQRQAELKAMYPDAKELQQLTPEQLRETFGDGPYHPSLGTLGHVPGFASYVRSNPSTAKKIYDATSIVDVSDVVDLKRPDFVAAAQRASRIVPTTSKIKIGSSDAEYYVAVAPESATSRVPALQLKPPWSLDHNGAMMKKGLVLGEDGKMKWEASNETRAFVPIRPEQLVVDPKTGRTVQNMREVAVFSGHGSPYGFEGVPTEDAAKTMAQQILRYEKQNPNATRLKYVALMSCSQGNRRGPFFGDTNAMDFERTLNRELAAAGREPVGVLASERPGLLLANTQNVWVETTWSKYNKKWARDARFVPTEAQMYRLSPQENRYLLVGGAIGATVGGAGTLGVGLGTYAYVRHQQEQAEQRRREQRQRMR
ncbi:MAG: DUF4781 domain-containing protein [Deltaproteobacteria bacterium]|jgi:hypothetical protein